MPAFRSLYVLTALAACLAQVSAGGDYSDGGSGSSGQGSYGGGSSGGSSHDSGSGGSGGGNYNNQWTSTTDMMTTTMVSTEAQAQTCPAAATMTETMTVTAVSACSSSVVTAYVTQWMNAPPGCWCGSGSPPAAAVSSYEMGAMANVASFMSVNPTFTPGLSSIPASDALQTGVTVAAAAAAPAATTTAAPGGFFTESSSSAAATTTGY